MTVGRSQFFGLPSREGVEAILVITGTVPVTTSRVSERAVWIQTSNKLKHLDGYRWKAAAYGSVHPLGRPAFWTAHARTRAARAARAARCELRLRARSAPAPRGPAVAPVPVPLLSDPAPARPARPWARPREGDGPEPFQRPPRALARAPRPYARKGAVPRRHPP